MISGESTGSINVLSVLEEDADEPFSSEASFVSFLTQLCKSQGMMSDFSDDCGSIPEGTRLVSTDTIIDGRHFDTRSVSPSDIGKQAAVASLSDLAASGGRPNWALLSLELPTHWQGSRLRRLCTQFVKSLAQYDVCLVGGNCTQTDGPLALTVTVGGSLYGTTPIRRDSAVPGDVVCVSGTLGKSALVRFKPSAEHRALRHSWRPHFEESMYLATNQIPSSMLDISDGLILDASRIATASSVDINLRTDCLPILPRSPNYSVNEAIYYALYGGEDYVLLFTCPRDTTLPSWAHAIGSVSAGTGKITLDGASIQMDGFDHFITNEEKRTPQ